jgi:hypothetical protein
MLGFCVGDEARRLVCSSRYAVVGMTEGVVEQHRRRLRSAVYVLRRGGGSG